MTDYLKYIESHLEYFVGPRKPNLGWDRPGGLPEYYRRNPEEWRSDVKAVELWKRAERIERGAPQPAGLSKETAGLIEEIRSLHRMGMDPAEIASRLDMPERSVAKQLGRIPAGAGTPLSPHVERLLKSGS